MSVYGHNDEDLQQREQELKEREMKVRLRELEAELETQKKRVAETTEQTAVNELDSDALARQRKNRKILLFAKLGGLAVGVALTVIVLNVLLFPMIVMGALVSLMYGAYILFIKEPSKANTPQEK